MYTTLWCALLVSVTGALFAQETTRLVSLSPAGATPGTMVEAVVTGVPPSGLNYVVLAFPDAQIPVPVDALEEPGHYRFLTPYSVDPTSPEGYRLGRLRAGAMSEAGEFTGDLPFEIRALPPVEDAPGQFRQIVRDLAARNRGGLASLREKNPDLVEFIDILDGFTDGHESNLLALADRIGESKLTTFPLSLRQSDPSAEGSIEVDERMLAHFVGVWREHSASVQAINSDSKLTSRSLEGPQPRRGPGCIFDALGGENSPWEYCIFASRLTNHGVAAVDDYVLESLFHRAFVGGSSTQLGGSGQCPVIDRRALGPQLLAANMAQMLHRYGLTCYFHPVRPVELRAEPMPDPIPVGVTNQGTKIVMKLEPFWKSPEEAFGSMLRPSYYETLQAFLARKVAPDCGPALLANYMAIAADILKAAEPAILEAVGKIQQKAAGTREVPLYKCDLDGISPRSNGTVVRAPELDKDDELRWGLQGVATGTSEVVLRPVYNNFPENSIKSLNVGDPCTPPFVPNQQFATVRWLPRVAPCVKVSANGGKSALAVSSAYIFSYKDEGPQPPKTYPPLEIGPGPAWLLENNLYSASVSASVEQLTPTRWKIVQKSTGAPTASRDVISSWNRLDLVITHSPGPRKIRAKVSSDVKGTCQGLDASLGPVSQRKDGNNGCAADWTIETLSPNGNGTVPLMIRFVVLGGFGTSFGPGSGTVTTEVELLNESQ